jgi:competence protein ComEA
LPEGGFNFELNENVDIFNFTSSPVGESDTETAPAEAAADLPMADPFAAAPAPEPEEAAVPEPEVAEPEVAEAEEAEAGTDQGSELDAADGEPDAPAEESPMGGVFGPAVIGPELEAPVQAMTASASPGDAQDGILLLSGLDLNQADAEEMSSRLDGVGPRLAARIVRHREVNGPFRGVADLARVQGVGPSTYRKMTGQSWSEARDSLKRTLDYVLDSEGQDAPDLKAVARRIHSLSGFEGCVFAHTDGHMLAASWNDDKQDILGAVAPQMLKKLLPYVEELDVGDLNPLVLCLGDTAICLSQSGNVIMATIHRATGLGRRQTRLIELLSTELETRFEVTLGL